MPGGRQARLAERAKREATESQEQWSRDDVEAGRPIAFLQRAWSTMARELKGRAGSWGRKPWERESFGADLRGDADRDRLEHGSVLA